MKYFILFSFCLLLISSCRTNINCFNKLNDLELKNEMILILNKNILTKNELEKNGNCISKA